MTGADLATVHAAVADRLRALVPRAGSSSRLVALAIVLERLGYADGAQKLRATEVGDSSARLDDLADALFAWSWLLSSADAEVLEYAVATLRLASLEAQWRAQERREART
jgi:hypothetical protein